MMDRKEPLAPIEGARISNPTVVFKPDLVATPMAHRIWYHVPRVGDFVDLGADGHGVVDSVTWTDLHVIVTLQQSGRRE